MVKDIILDHIDFYGIHAIFIFKIKLGINKSKKNNALPTAYEQNSNTIRYKDAVKKLSFFKREK